MENSVEATTPAVEVTTSASEPAVEPKSETPSVEALKEEIAKWKNYSRMHEETAKTLLSEKEKWDTTKSEYETKLSETTSELEARTSELTKVQHETLKMKMAVDYKLPNEAMALLKGSTEEELKAEAELIAKLHTTSGREPLFVKTHGKENSGKGDISDPKEALKVWAIQNLNK